MPIIADVVASSGPTLDQLITEIVSAAQGHAIAPDKMVTLRDDLSSTGLVMMIDGTASPGVFEVGDELILVSTVDNNTGTCVVHPRGRGWQGTTPADHLAGDVVVDGPAFSRARVRTSINDVLAGLYPTLYGVSSVTSTHSGTMLELPSDAESVLDVRTLEDGEWLRTRHWEAEMSSGAAVTGRVVRLPRTVEGATVQVVYSTRPETLSTNDQQWSDTGLSPATKDIVVMGVLARFAQVLDMGRLTDRFSSPKGDPEQPQLGAGFAMARQIKADYQAALDREAAALRNLYPARVHFVR